MAKLLLNSRSVTRAAPRVGQEELWDTLLPGFGLRISAGGARTFFVMRRVQGKLVRRTVGRAHIGEGPTVEGEFRLPDARDAARRMLSDLQRGIDPKAEAAAKAHLEILAQSKADKHTFKAVAAAYFADPGKRGGCRLKSRPELERKVRVDLACWHDIPLSEITRAEVRALLHAKAKTSPIAANRLLALIRRILRWAVREEIVPINVANDLEPTPEIERERVLTFDEIARIWHGCTAIGYPFGPAIKLMILTAQRRSEVAELRWAELDGSVWRLPDSRAKRGKGHLVPLSKRAELILRDQPKIGANADLVFSSGRRRTPPPPGTKLQPAPLAGWSRAKARLDLKIAEERARQMDETVDTERHGLAPWTLHDIRRSVATHLRDGDVMGDARVDRLIVSKILNHAEGGMTRLYDRYSADPEQRAALEAWAQKVEAMVGLNSEPLQRHGG